MTYTDVDSATLDLFNEVKEEFPDVADAKFKVVFRDKKKGNDTRIIFAEICRFSPLVKHITTEIPEYEEDGLHYCVIIDQIAWECFSEQERRLILFHELCHCAVDFKESGEVVYGLRDHEVQDFYAVIKKAQELGDPEWSRRCAEVAVARHDEIKEKEKAEKKAARKKK